MAPAALQAIQQLIQAGRLVEAEAALRQAMRRGSTPALDHTLAVTLLRLGRFDQAEFFADRAAAATNAPEAWTTLASARGLLGHRPAAIDAFARALAARPDHAPARLGLAQALQAEQRLTEALEVLEPARTPTPTSSPALLAAVEAASASLRLWTGRAEEAFDQLTAAVDRFPDDEMLASALAHASNYHPSLTAAQIDAIHRRYGDLFTRNLRVNRPPYAPRTPGAPLRVGFLSPDLRRHSVASFLLPLWRALDPALVQILGYASNPADEVTAELAAAASLFRPVAHLSDQDLARQIHADRTDILIDLAGHTMGRRLPVFFLRPAPIQVSYLGYPAITGLPTIDARLVDHITDPPTPSDRMEGPERPIRLPAPFLTYAPPLPATRLPPTTRDPGRPITFGSFNAVPKINPAVLDTWSAILRAVPGSRLLLKAAQFGDAPTRDRHLAAFTSRGVAPDRVEILPPTPGSPDGLAAHLDTYRRIDIALDTFPYGGTTTTCEAALMGAPTITLAPDAPNTRHASRVGATLNTALGAPELITASPDAYARAATDLAADADRRASYHATLRDRLIRGSLGDAARLARAFETALSTLADAPRPA